tara:strand:- start:2873 stop:3214 length:342 start_codon:yes stop_codon:yes gene_type:complete
MKTKKKQRQFRCTDTLYSLVEAASKEAEMSVNEWVLSAIRTQLKEGVHGEGLDVDNVSELATAQAINNYSQSNEKAAEVLKAAIEKTDKIFELSRERLERSLQLKRNQENNKK